MKPSDKRGFTHQLHRLHGTRQTLFIALGQHLKHLNTQARYVIDSFPSACATTGTSSGDSWCKAKPTAGSRLKRWLYRLRLGKRMPRSRTGRLAADRRTNSKRLHGPQQKFLILHFHRGVETVASFYYLHGYQQAIPFYSQQGVVIETSGRVVKFIKTATASCPMPATNQPQPVIEFHRDRARFQGAAYENRRRQLQQQTDELADKAVVDRDPGQLAEVLSNAWVNAAATRRKRHFHYFVEYLGPVPGGGLGAQTIEQDNNVSACATTALWMAFHKTAGLFQTPLPSPYHITANARNLFNQHGRNFPSAGLDQTQIGEAIQAVGLVAELRTYRQAGEWGLAPGSAEDQRMAAQLRGAQGFLYAYLRLGLPVLLFLLLDEDPQQGHLITVTGYRLSGATVPPSGELSLTADTMDRLYAHDDQMGPYARYSFTEDGRLLTPWSADADWATTARWRTYRRASLYSLFVPLTAGIRITYEQVHRQVSSFELLLADAVLADVDVVWDIYLSFGNAYKDELRRQRPVTGAPLQAILTAALPKYVWVARATLGQIAMLELIFDATDLHTGFYCLLVNVFTPLRASLTEALREPGFRRRLSRAPGFDARFLPLLLRDLEIGTSQRRARR
uniref:Uncharacterized protein n=1 Tax=Tanacetum cinerariifolium TaxID=118510 RepID=A0A6L2N6L6_TANCI|nr:hypothetical protein [Tanacetum cinerariifolium]